MIDKLIPEGTLHLLEDHEVTERKRRPLKAISVTLSAKALLVLQGAMKAEELDAAEAEKVIAATEATWWTYLAGWDLPQEFPKVLADLQDLPGALYDHVTKAVDEYMGTLAKPDEKFTVDAIEDETSPTGASGGSNGPSEATTTSTSTP